jgi:dephospho-CoA kinase
MLKVALTGGIATGKSYILARFRHHGIPTLDADAMVHGIESAGTEATSAIAARFGDVLSPDGSVDRARLGPIVFADSAARRDLEAIIHPAVYRAIEAGLRAFALTGADPFCVVDVPLLFETGGNDRFDRVIVAACARGTQIARLLARGITEEAAAQRLDAQWPTDSKAARADYVIRTDGTFDNTNQQVDMVLSKLVSGQPL